MAKMILSAQDDLGVVREAMGDVALNGEPFQTVILRYEDGFWNPNWRATWESAREWHSQILEMITEW